MNSKVHNPYTVVMIAGALALALVAASPATLPAIDSLAVQSGAGSMTPAGTDTTPAEAARIGDEAAFATLDAEAAVVAGLAAPFQDTAAAPAVRKSSRTSGQSRRIRQSMAMPFFSFLPRG